MSRRAASRLGPLLLCVFGFATLSVLLSCTSSSSITFGTNSSSAGGEEEAGGEVPEPTESRPTEATLFTAADDIRALTGETNVDPRNLSPLAGRGVLFFDQASESIILLDLDGTPILFTPRDQLLAATGHGSVELGPMDEIEAGPFDGQTLCADAVSGLLLRIGADGIPHLHVTEDQVLAATGGSRARLHLPRSMTGDEIIAQDLESMHILSFGVRGDAEIAVDRSLLSAAAGVPEDAAEISGWARGPLSGDQFASFASTNAVVRIGAGGLVVGHVHPEILRAIFPKFKDPTVVGLATDEEGSDELFILVSDDGLGKGIAIVSPGGAVRLFTNFNDFPETIGVARIFDFGFLTLGRDRIFYAMDGIGEEIFVLDEGGTPEEVSGPGELLDATGAPRINLGPGAAVDDLGLVVLEPESDSFVLLRGLGRRVKAQLREWAGSAGF